MTQSRQYTWEDAIAAIGQDFGGVEDHVADEAIEVTAVARYCEPWEISNPIYWNRSAAKKAGYKNIVAPWSGLRQTWSYKGFWRPGDATRFAKDMNKDQSARLGSFQPAGKPLPTPPTRQGIVTDLEIEFFEPACVGDRLNLKGRRLVNVRPRQTRIGYGAFYNTASDIFNQRGELVAKINFGLFSYNPGEQQPGR
ncbi:MAG: hypothetical protein EXR53_06340 [Dehalococcoidia bacterium]|nr:hypothetical protein [Dehalococcoidia bacterium]